MNDLFIPYPGRAWGNWEQDPRIDDGHAHDWEMVVVETYPGHSEPVTRCKHCHAPRCGFTFATDPCTQRRHHRDMHIYESGRFEPLGGILPPECTCGHEDQPYGEHVLPCEVADLHQRRERIRRRESGGTR